MATYASGYSNGYRVRIEQYQISQNWDNNTSVVRVDAYIDATTTWFNARVNGSASNNGVVFWNPGGGIVNLGGLGSKLMAVYDVTVAHDSNGNASASASMNAATTDTTSSWRMPYRETSGSVAMSRIPQFPGAPTALTFSRSLRAVTVSTSGAPANGGTILEYRIERTTANQTAWSGVFAGNGGTFSDLDLGASYRFRSQARTDRGWGPFADIGGSVTIPNVPSAPTVTVGTVSGRACTVTCNEPSNGGAGITQYYIQASADNGATWGTEAVMGLDRSESFTNLTGGAFYKFRVRAQNEMGYGAYGVSASTFIPSGGKRYNGTAYVPTSTAKRYNGTAWVDISTAKRYNGTAWVDLS
jgi:hypothetical protein